MLQDWEIVVRINPNYFRPTEVDLLIGDYSKAHKELDWKPQIGVEELCKEMVYADLKRIQDELHNSQEGITPIETLAHEEGGFLAWHDKNLNKN